MKKRHILAVKGCEFQMKMKSVKAVLIFLLLLAGMVTGYLLWSMRELEMLVENEVTAYYNMTETGIPAFAAAPASLLIEENGEGWSENL